MTGYSPTSGVLHGTQAGRKLESVKKICRVTTRRCNRTLLRGLRRGDTLAARTLCLSARTLCLGMPGFDCIVLTTSGLPPRRLPAPDQAEAFGILAVTLIPTSWLILTPTAFAQADPRPRSSRTGTLAAVWAIMTGAHGSAVSPGTVRGERAIVLLGRFS